MGETRPRTVTTIENPRNQGYKVNVYVRRAIQILFRESQIIFLGHIHEFQQLDGKHNQIVLQQRTLLRPHFGL